MLTLKLGGEDCSHTKKSNNQVYCSDCGCEYQKQGTKTIICVDCGAEVEVDARDNKSIRCTACQNRQEINIKLIKYYRHKAKEDLIIFHVQGLFLLQPKATKYLNDINYIANEPHPLNKPFKYNYKFSFINKKTFEKVYVFATKLDDFALDYIIPISNLECTQNKDVKLVRF